MSGIRVLRVILQVLLIAVLTLLLLTEGGVRPEPLHVLSTLAYALAALSMLFLNDRSGSFAPVLIALVLAAIIAGWGLFQAGMLPFPGPVHPVWSSAAEILGPLSGTISIAPADTIAAISPVVLPFFVFIACYTAFDTDKAALILLGSGLAIGVVGALVAIVQLELFPDSLMFGPKLYYLDSLTAFFVNRNTSATYLAMQMIIAAGFCFYYASDTNPRDILRILMGYQPTNPERKLISAPAPLAASVAAFLVFFTALMMTKSRGGIGSGFSGLAFFAVLAAIFGPYRRKRRSMGNRAGESASSTSRLSMAVLVFIVICAAGSLFAGRAIFRAEVGGLGDERFCMYPSMLKLVADNWQYGTGLGTFETAFTPYRPSACELMSIFDRAHNVYIEAMSSIGILAVPLMLFAVMSLIVISILGLLTRREFRWVPMVGLGVLLTVILHSAVDFSLQIPGFAMWFAATMAASARISLGRR